MWWVRRCVGGRERRTFEIAKAPAMFSKQYVNAVAQAVLTVWLAPSQGGSPTDASCRHARIMSLQPPGLVKLERASSYTG